MEPAVPEEGSIAAEVQALHKKLGRLDILAEWCRTLLVGVDTISAMCHILVSSHRPQEVHTSPGEYHMAPTVVGSRLWGFVEAVRPEGKSDCRTFW